MARIEFDLDGNILDANDNFLKVFGYSRGEVIGKHHRMLCEASYA
ncbi:PAS domain-containing protein, partial [Chromobacterium piscinae]